MKWDQSNTTGTWSNETKSWVKNSSNMSCHYLNASRISSSQPSSFFFRTIIVRNSGNSMVPLPMTSDLQNWKQSINCCNPTCAQFQQCKTFNAQLQIKTIRPHACEMHYLTQNTWCKNLSCLLMSTRIRHSPASPLNTLRKSSRYASSSYLQKVHFYQRVTSGSVLPQLGKNVSSNNIQNVYAKVQQNSPETLS